MNREPPNLEISSYGKTLAGAARFHVVVKLTQYGGAHNYHLDVSADGTALEQKEASDGDFVQTTLGGYTSYSFSAQAFELQNDGGFAWGDWSAPITRDAPPDYSSLSAFLRASVALGVQGVDPADASLRALLKRAGARTLRALLVS
ncbi:hypothetical protein DFR50_113131 [Roseiarcus fermentans]|uniref:Uncharacterized protein n=1 Tax=Roseiarcus fermentans TaxID=1473586 RepID=A0A366FGU7_9HYPH|nr:hypothetical protein [Roseiarcus fermentans]RBP12939.1 hypothetical protein DFR50_113131 [Roseiarcus fermentans]